MEYYIKIWNIWTECSEITSWQSTGSKPLFMEHTFPHYHPLHLFTCQYEAPIVWSVDALCQVTVKCILKNPQDICSKIFLAFFFYFVLYNESHYEQLVHKLHFTLFKYLIFLSSLYISSSLILPFRYSPLCSYWVYEFHTWHCSDYECHHCSALEPVLIAI